MEDHEQNTKNISSLENNTTEMPDFIASFASVRYCQVFTQVY